MIGRRCLRVLAAVLAMATAGMTEAADDARTEVMRALFGAADAAGRHPLPEISLPADTDPAIARDWQGQAAQLQALAWQESGPREARRGVLLVEAMRLDERGRPVDCHACPALLSSYRVELRDGAWQLRDTHPGFAESGSFGRAGSAVFTELGPRRPGFALTHIGGGQGYFAESLRLFELAGARVVGRTTTPISIAAENSGACADDDPALPACYAVHGRWQFDRRTLVEGLWPLQVRFSGSRNDAAGHPVAISDNAEWRPRQGQYLLSSGRNPTSD